MDHHVDIRLHIDPDLPRHVLMDDLFGRLHRALAATGRGDIAVAFPGYTLRPVGLGTVLRLIGPAPRLEDFVLAAGSGLRLPAGTAHLTDPAPVPMYAEHRALRRIQIASNAERLRRRLMRRHDISYEAALLRIPDSVETRLRLPFITLHSVSTGQRFPLFLHLGAAEDSPRPGKFNAYGLSSTATVPWF